MSRTLDIWRMTELPSTQRTVGRTCFILATGFEEFYKNFEDRYELIQRRLEGKYTEAR